MYKIMTLVRSENQPLWTPLFVKEIKLVDDTNGVPNENTGKIPQIEVTETVEYQTDDLVKLEEKIIELMKTYNPSTLKVIQDVTYSIDLLIV